MKRELAAREKDKIEFTKKLQAINDDMKKAEENRAKVEKQMEDALKEADENRAKMEKQMELRQIRRLGSMIRRIAAGCQLKIAASMGSQSHFVNSLACLRGKLLLMAAMDLNSSLKEFKTPTSSDVSSWT